VAPADLLRAEPLVGAAELPPVPDADVLGLDDDMRRFVAGHVNRRAQAERRLERLLDAVIGEAQLGVEYNERTHTARETFRAREANCLSFTNLVVALGREAGLDVRFQEVDVPPDWSRTGDTLVLNRHINALVTHTGGRDQVVDFNMRDFRATYDRRVVSDARALAHYYTNLAVERMQAGDTPGAVRHFRKAAAQEPGFTAAWVNLGTLYLREGHPEWAGAAWRHALALDPGEQVALSNLERLERDAGRPASADELARMISRHRMQNPYYRYHLAQEAFDAGEYRAAIGHLRFAVDQKRNEDRFMALLGLAYLRDGDEDAARSWLARAAAAAEDPGQRERYHTKLEKLARSGAG
jgi:Flp pilus assembly protein TadD